MTGKITVYPLPGSRVRVADLAFHQMGDVNWDGYIDDIDIDLLKKAFGSVKGGINYNPDADLNADGVVDLSDYFKAALNYGKEAPAHDSPFTQEVSAGKVVFNVRPLPGIPAVPASVTIAEGQAKNFVVLPGPFALALEAPLPLPSGLPGVPFPTASTAGTMSVLA